MVTPGGGRNVIGQAVVVLRASGKQLTAGLKKAQAETSSRVGKMQAKWQGFANRIPVVGGALAALATPAGLATAAIGLTVGVLTKMVTKTLSVGRELGRLREATGETAENIQIYQRAIEETNGDAKAFETTTLRLTRSIGDARRGNKATIEAFDALGLSFADVKDKSPAEALKTIVGRANETLAPTERASVLSALLGRSYANLGGFANMTTDELNALTEGVADSAVVMSGDAVDGVDEFDATWRELRDILGKAAVTVGQQVIPKLTSLIQSVIKIGTALWPVIQIITVPLKNAFDILFGSLELIGNLLSGDFKGAWNTVKDTALSVMENIVSVYNNTIGRIPGVAKIDMDKVRAALDTAKEGGEGLSESMVEVAETTEAAGDTTEEAGWQIEETAEKVQTLRERVDEWKEANRTAEAFIDQSLLPTLDDLIAKFEEQEEALKKQDEAFERSVEIQRQWYASLRQEARDTQAEITAAAEETAQAQADAAKKAADAIQAETDRINSSWDSFIVKQDETVKAMDDAGVNFGELIEALAARNGVSTVEMAQHYATLGVKYGDVLALIEAAGRATIDATLGELGRLQEAAAVAQAAIRRTPGRSGDGIGPGQGGPGDAIARAIAIAKAGGQVPNFQVPEAASGGITARNTLAQLHSNEAIIPLSKLPNILRRMNVSGQGGMGGGNTYNFPNYVGNEDDLKRIINEARLEFERRGN